MFVSLSLARIIQGYSSFLVANKINFRDSKCNQAHYVLAIGQRNVHWLRTVNYSYPQLTVSVVAVSRSTIPCANQSSYLPPRIPATVERLVILRARDLTPSRHHVSCPPLTLLQPRILLVKEMVLNPTQIWQIPERHVCKAAGCGRR